jgi:predicted TIM-barrel enzyme
VSGAMIQNVDFVYRKKETFDPYQISSLTIICEKLKTICPRGFMLGIEVMPCCTITALGIAKSVGLDFVKTSDFLTIKGQSKSELMQSRALKILDYREKIKGRAIKLFVDIFSRHKQHNLDLVAVAKIANRIQADAITFDTGDHAKNLEICKLIKQIIDIPVYLSGGTNNVNANESIKIFDGLFVGSYFEGLNWGQEINASNVRNYMDSIDA